ncbi:MAG: hypothetical protein A3K19_07355 [Lentisphaerae bacterium RIFOXYB12_FULL_65_16]|nr:MAG: hypothetical protein A3K18_21560 [Lentisphaerae bacterium RIFOXYA12_64_32]OGV93359.1 MAG: hypothetical protein A3K19_07355 [Lentisphaerae bacterium RIFOXYB12_FULL_65_16]
MPQRRRMFWLLFPRYLTIILVSMVAVFAVFRYVIEGFYRDDTRGQLEALARVVALRLQAAVEAEDQPQIQAECLELGRLCQARFTVVLRAGKVMGDTYEIPANMDNHADRPEIRTALEQGTVGTSERFSHTIQTQMFYVAIPIVKDGRALGVVRVARPLSQLQSAIRSAQDRVLVGGLGIALIAGLLSLLIARRITAPIEEIRAGAERYAQGDFTCKILQPDAAELGDLAQAMNRMAAEIEARIATVTDQRNELEAILRSMIEGVLAVDQEQRLLTVNNAAFVLLGMQRADVHGKSLQEVVRCPALHKLATTALQQEASVEGEIVLYDQDRERIVQVHGTALHDAAGVRTGAALVLNDITRLRRLENVRRDFVANVSHELRTPITSLKASVETLLDGAMREPENAHRFLQIILRHADRMNAIINDLLLLAQMDLAEKDDAPSRLEWKVIPAVDLLQAAMRVCAVKAEKKGIQVSHDCPNGLSVRCDTHLIEQAIINLLDNAINYSEGGRPVRVSARAEDADVLIAVQDQGSGIPSNHLPRIFERFYRVDKARSREQGGTGLGLAIVKHIVQAHGGSVAVESEVGKGSTFTIRLPAPRQNGKA